MSRSSGIRRSIFWSLSFLIGLILATAATPSHAEETATSPGEVLYQERCAMCHEGGVARAPDRNALRQLAPERTGFALAYGI
jgi:polyvinyl alcohol dehydrogenase (cytochrome)